MSFVVRKITELGDVEVDFCAVLFSTVRVWMVLSRSP